MTPTDLYDRLTEFGYESTIFDHLHYAQLPVIAPLDTPQGGIALCQAAHAVGAEIVIIDTTGRSVQGEENDAGTYQDFYRHTGMQLKRMGITWARLDHAGKDTTRGQRGSSAKNDDVDIVVNLTRTPTGITWTASDSGQLKHYDLLMAKTNKGFLELIEYLVFTVDELTKDGDLNMKEIYAQLHEKYGVK